MLKVGWLEFQNALAFQIILKRFIVILHFHSTKCEKKYLIFFFVSEELHPYNLNEFELLDQKIYEINCNWKLLMENFVEWYHIYPVHPELSEFSGPEEHFNGVGDGNYCSLNTFPLKQSGGIGDNQNWNLRSFLTESD